MTTDLFAGRTDAPFNLVSEPVPLVARINYLRSRISADIAAGVTPSQLDQARLILLEDDAVEIFAGRDAQ